MSGYPHGGMGPPPPGPPPPIPPRPSIHTYRQGTQQTYHSQETAESPARRIPYHETEVLISTVESSSSTSSPAVGTYSENNLSRNSSRRYQETYAIQSVPPETEAFDSSFRTYSTYSETTEHDPRQSSHNMAVESRGHMETEQVSDGMYEGLTQLGWGGMAFYDTSRPSNWTPAPPENVHQDRDNTGLRTVKKEVEPEYEKISMDYYDHFTPTFTPATSAPPPIASPVSEHSQAPSRSSSTRETNDSFRPGVPHLSVSDPFPISVDQERYYSDQSNLRESQFPELVNPGGSDPLWQPPSRSYTSYRRTPRREDEKKAIYFDSTGLPSLSGVLGPAAGLQEPSGRNSFHFDDEKRLYPNNYNQSSLSINSTHSENIPPSSRYNNSVHRTPSYASLRPDNDSRPQDTKYNYNSPQQQTGPCRDGIPPPPVRYLSQKQGNKLGQLLQEKKMDYVVCEMNRKDELHRRMQEESRRYGY
ncbi:hypothetical protein TWF106_001630 [Orbilia oligospora]|uniref:Uncharacterized protein n=1 Tax=Orbilia oligospora TaxID=2813651 RepID=A0A7C8QAN0_ORBOL|nr:hypothetical protein TWF106_001630 [Orbilia oligospora]